MLVLCLALVYSALGWLIAYSTPQKNTMISLHDCTGMHLIVSTAPSATVDSGRHSPVSISRPIIIIYSTILLMYIFFHSTQLFLSNIEAK